MPLGDRAEHDRLLGAILRRFLTHEDECGHRAFYFIHEDRLTLDGAIPIEMNEAIEMLRVTKGQIDGLGLRHSPPEVWQA